MAMTKRLTKVYRCCIHITWAIQKCHADHIIVMSGSFVEVECQDGKMS